MLVPSDINRLIASQLTLRDLPSLRACKTFSAFRGALIEQQALLFGWNSQYGTSVDFIKKTFAAIKSLNHYSFCVYGLNNGIYGLRVYDTLYYLRDIPLNQVSAPLTELDPAKFPHHSLILVIMGLSRLEEINPASQDVKDKALMQAVKFNAVQLSVNLLQRGANPNFLSLRTAFQEVVAKGNVDLANVFLSFSIDKRALSISYESTLQIAVDAGIKMVELLLRHGFEDFPTETGTAFSKALRLGKVDIAKRLKEQAMKHCRDSARNTYLHLAMEFPQESWMLQNYSPAQDLNAFNTPMMTPLHVAAYKINAEGIRYLIANGANPNIPGILGKTAIEMTPDHLKHLYGRAAKRRRKIVPSK